MNEYTAKNNDFTEFNENKWMSLVKVDKNGSHHYIDSRCPKCGGEGHIFGYEHVEGGRCFMCGGSGRYERKVIVRTEEYARKLAEKRERQNREKAEAHNLEFLKKEGFTPEGKTYIVLGNTYPIKEQLKRDGAFFSRQLGWHFNHPVEEYPVHELDMRVRLAGNTEDPITLFNVGAYGAYNYHSEFDYLVIDYIKGIQNEYLKSTLPETYWFGTIGERVTVTNCEYCLLTRWESRFGTTYIYKFTAPDGLVFTWKTSKYISEEGSITVTGTVKDHTEYKGQKQTELTRCKIS